MTVTTHDAEHIAICTITGDGLETVEVEKMNKRERIEKWESVVSDRNWSGNKDAAWLAKNYGDDELADALRLCGQDISDDDYDDGR